MNKIKVAIAGKNDQHRLTPEHLAAHPHIAEIRTIEVTRLFHPAETEKMLGADVLVCMLPDGVSTTLLQWLREHGFAGFVLDTGVDFRLKSREDAIRYYRHEGFEPEAAALFRYVHPDLDDGQITFDHKYYSIPGTISTLLLPTLKAILSSQTLTDLWITAILPNYVETESRIQAFQIFTYFETGEILAESAKWTAKLPKTSIIPVHMSVSRGCWTTITFDGADASAMDAALEKLMLDRPFLNRVFDVPSLGNVLNTNLIQIGYKRRGTQMVVGAAMDDQIKAGPGLVIPILNTLFGWPAHTGLS